MTYRKRRDVHGINAWYSRSYDAVGTARIGCVHVRVRACVCVRAQVFGLPFEDLSFEFLITYLQWFLRLFSSLSCHLRFHFSYGSHKRTLFTQRKRSRLKYNTITYTPYTLIRMLCLMFACTTIGVHSHSNFRWIFETSMRIELASLDFIIICKSSNPGSHNNRKALVQCKNQIKFEKRRTEGVKLNGSKHIQ